MKRSSIKGHTALSAGVGAYRHRATTSFVRGTLVRLRSSYGFCRQGPAIIGALDQRKIAVDVGLAVVHMRTVVRDKDSRGCAVRFRINELIELADYGEECRLRLNAIFARELGCDVRYLYLRAVLTRAFESSWKIDGNRGGGLSRRLLAERGYCPSKSQRESPKRPHAATPHPSKII